jgi:RNA polymerase sigma-70 factor (ECF subfamily)
MFARAYRVLGSPDDAEEVVQEALLRVHEAEIAGTMIRDPAPFALIVADRVAIDRRRGARMRLEFSAGATVAAAAASVDPGPAEHAEIVEDLGQALPVLVQSLTPLERAVLLLREAFGYPYPEIACLVGKTESNCRQIKVRARRHLESLRGDGGPIRAQDVRLAREFADACERGDAVAAVRLVGGHAATKPCGPTGARSPVAPASPSRR